MTPHKVCVVYGALPAETRRSQAQLFNTPGTGWVQAAGSGSGATAEDAT